jgi:hypothetical protein
MSRKRSWSRRRWFRQGWGGTDAGADKNAEPCEEDTGRVERCGQLRGKRGTRVPHGFPDEHVQVGQGEEHVLRGLREVTISAAYVEAPGSARLSAARRPNAVESKRLPERTNETTPTARQKVPNTRHTRDK